MNIGDLAPNFSLPDQNGHTRTLSELLTAGPVVLFFYPAAMTAGCTKESCHFRDLAGEFAAVGAQRIGISMDTVEKQLAFGSQHSLDYPLLADLGGVVAKTYGVKRPVGFLKVRRTTFVIGSDGIIRDKISSEMDMNVHADRALAALRA
ncbi:MAG: peroxiredoxin [Actinomycetota bacterium]|jgi:peroxiredoxin Q/BCP